MSSYPYSAIGAAGAATSFVVQGRLGTCVVLSGIVASLSAAPAAPVQVSVTGNQSGRGYAFDLVAAGAQELPSPDGGMRFDLNEAVTVAVGAPGGAVVAKVNASAQWDPY